MDHFLSLLTAKQTAAIREITLVAGAETGTIVWSYDHSQPNYRGPTFAGVKRVNIHVAIQDSTARTLAVYPKEQSRILSIMTAINLPGITDVSVHVVVIGFRSGRDFSGSATAAEVRKWERWLESVLRSGGGLYFQAENDVMEAIGARKTTLRVDGSASSKTAPSPIPFPSPKVRRWP